MFLQWVLAIAPKAVARQGACLTLGSCPPEAMQDCPGEDGIGSFHGHSLDKTPATDGLDPEGMVTHSWWSSSMCGLWIRLEDRQGKIVCWRLHSPSHTGAGARHAGLQQWQMNDPEWARGLQPRLSWPICKWVGMTLNLDNIIQGWAESHRPWSRNKRWCMGSWPPLNIMTPKGKPSTLILWHLEVAEDSSGGLLCLLGLGQVASLDLSQVNFSCICFLTNVHLL